jgi:hypothetical protein
MTREARSTLPAASTATGSLASRIAQWTSMEPTALTGVAPRRVTTSTLVKRKPTRVCRPSVFVSSYGPYLPDRGDLAERDAALDVAVRVVGAGGELGDVEGHADGNVRAVVTLEPVPLVLRESLGDLPEVHGSSVEGVGQFFA